MTTTMKTKTRTTSSTTNSALADKARRLREILTGYESVLIAFSGGVDSAYLAIAAAEALGARALAVTADSPSYPDTHRRLALSIASDFGFAHEVIHTAELDRPEYRANPANRCYYCKDELYGRLGRVRRRARRRRRSSTATTPTIAATIVPGARRRANTACAARSTRPT